LYRHSRQHPPWTQLAKLTVDARGLG
jgi:hypothetical protein